MNRLQTHNTCHRPGAYWITLLGRRLWQSAMPISAEYNNYNIHHSSDHSERRSNFRQKFQEPGNDRLVYSLPRVLAFALHGVCRWYYITILNTDELAFLSLLNLVLVQLLYYLLIKTTFSLSNTETLFACIHTYPSSPT